MNATTTTRFHRQGQNLASRVPPTSSTAAPLRQKLPSSRNFVVFPVQLGQNKSPHESFPFTTYSISDLRSRHSYDPNLSQTIGEIWVDTASYYKQKQSPQHEFMIFSVTTNDGMRNVIALNRQVHVAGSSGFMRRNKIDALAQDYFHISHYGDLQSLVNHCGRSSSKDQCMHIEQFIFSSRAFSFAQLVVLAGTVNEWEPSYKLNRNDRWFSSLVWKGISEVFKRGITRHNTYSTDRGRLKGFTIAEHHDTLEKVLWKYSGDMVEFEKGLKDCVEAINAESRRDQKGPTVTHDASLRDWLRASNALASGPPTDLHRPPSYKSGLSTATASSNYRVPTAGKEKDHRSEPTKPPSTRTSNGSTITSTSSDPRSSTRTNKELPSLPPGLSFSRFSRPRSKSAQGSPNHYNMKHTGLKNNYSVAALSDTLGNAPYHHKETPGSPLDSPWIEVDPRTDVGYFQTRDKFEQSGVAYEYNSRIARGHLNVAPRRTWTSG